VCHRQVASSWKAFTSAIEGLADHIGPLVDTLGGVAEYLSMAVGYNTLAVVVAALFAKTTIGPYLDPIASMVVGYLGRRLSPENLKGLMEGVQESVKIPELAGAGFDPQGRLDPRCLLSNVAEYPAERRRTAVAAALSSLLSSLLVASDLHLNLHEKKAILHMAEKMANSNKH